jgi:hypothetical protein
MLLRAALALAALALPQWAAAALRKHVAGGPLNVIVSGDLESLPAAKD